MPRTTILTLPEHLAGPNPALAAELAQYLSQEHHLLEEALDLDVYYIDGRAEYMDHTVDHVAVDGGEVRIDYTVFYFVYFGCDDMNQDDDEDRQITGTWEGNKIEFLTPDAPPERYPSEEL